MYPTVLVPKNRFIGIYNGTNLSDTCWCPFDPAFIQHLGCWRRYICEELTANDQTEAIPQELKNQMLTAVVQGMRDADVTESARAYSY